MRMDTYERRLAHRYVRRVLHRELDSLYRDFKFEPDVTKRYDIGIKLEEVKALIVQFGGRS